MNGGKNKGYTIVEVLIVLAISGIMFVLAATFIGGRQGQVEFRQSVTDLDSQIETTINDVINGFYPAGGTFTCSPAGTGPTFPSGAVSQGANSGCIFLGKIVYLDPGTNSVRIFSVAGNRFDPPVGGLPVQSLSSVSLPASHPQTIYNSGVVNLTDNETLENGTIVTSIGQTTPSGSNTNAAFAIFSNLNTGTNAAGLISGSRSLNMYTVALTGTQGESDSSAKTATAAITDSDTVNKVEIGLQNGSHKACIVVGGSGKLTSSILWEQVCP